MELLVVCIPVLVDCFIILAVAEVDGRLVAGAVRRVVVAIGVCAGSRVLSLRSNLSIQDSQHGADQ